jgi:hypothetical protein
MWNRVPGNAELVKVARFWVFSGERDVSHLRDSRQIHGSARSPENYGITPGRGFAYPVPRPRVTNLCCQGL